MWTNEEIQLRIDVVVRWLQQKSEDAHTKGLVCGISGGVDSAVVAALCQKAFPNDSLGVIMPCHSNPVDREDALLVAGTLGLEVIEVDLGDAHSIIYEKVETGLDAKDYPDYRRKVGQGNLKARLRMATIYSVANLRNYLVVGTDNAAESYTGYFTKYGDGGVDLLPISSLTKTEVRSWAKVLGLPESIVTRIPTAGLWQGQTDEKEMGLTYDMIDKYLSGGNIPEDAISRIEHLHKISEHKRQMPPTIELPKYERLD
ncbi:MAG: NAD(+) synthetase [Gracilibacter sp. BRH_c7a]|nr:MAG: NAD(+) synthetase [Gracilibacter sp. BRH_c7a]